MPWTCSAVPRPLEARYLIKIILSDMRTGIKVSLVEEAIAAAYSVPIAPGSTGPDAERQSSPGFRNGSHRPFS